MRLPSALLLGLLAGCTAIPPLRPAPSAVPARACAGERLYAAMYSTRKHQLSGQNPVVGLFVSRDDGASWTHTGWTQGHAFAVMAAPGGCGDTVFVAGGNGVHRTIDGGAFWRITTGWRVTEVQDVTLDPHDVRRVFAATPYGVFASPDLGETWHAATTGLTSTFVASVRVDRATPGRVFAGTEAGLFVSTDGGQSWAPTSLTAPIRSIRQSPSEPRRWVAGLQGRGVALSDDGGQTWRVATGAPAGRTIYEAEFHPTEARTVYAGGWEAGVLVTRDFGQTWRADTTGLADRNVHALAVSRRHPGTVYAGTLGGGLFVSRDDARTWQPVAPAVFEAGQLWDLYVEGEQ